MGTVRWPITGGLVAPVFDLHPILRPDFAYKRGRCAFAEDARKETLKKKSPRYGRGERGGYDLLKGRLISLVHPRFFFAGTALDF